MLKGIEILLTEDKEVNQEIFIGMLEGSGINIDIAFNGKEAVEKSRKKVYSLIVMDIEMPIMNGYEASKIIRTENTQIPIIALTSNNSSYDILKTKEIGINEHLCKPIEAKILYETFSKYINKGEPMNEKISLPNSPYINTSLGLKYLNGNKKLYLKILNSFLTRYQHFDITTLGANELKNEMHTLKGLSSTLGMESLSNLAQTLHSQKTEKLLLDFSKTLTLIIDDLKRN